MPEIYDLEKGKIINTISRAHIQTIFSCRHYTDTKKRIDYLISSSYDRTVKVWDLKTFSHITVIINAHSGYYIYSVSIFKCLLWRHRSAVAAMGTGTLAPTDLGVDGCGINLLGGGCH